jgi:hypothetical protein
MFGNAEIIVHENGVAWRAVQAETRDRGAPKQAEEESDQPREKQSGGEPFAHGE